jgi:hypothetical protein
MKQLSIVFVFQFTRYCASATHGRAILHPASWTLHGRNDLVRHYLVCGAAWLLDRVSEQPFTVRVADVACRQS